MQQYNHPCKRPHNPFHNCFDTIPYNFFHIAPYMLYHIRHNSHHIRGCMNIGIP